MRLYDCRIVSVLTELNDVISYKKNIETSNLVRVTKNRSNLYDVTTLNLDNLKERYDVFFDVFEDFMNNDEVDVEFIDTYNNLSLTECRSTIHHYIRALYLLNIMNLFHDYEFITECIVNQLTEKMKI